MTDLESTKRIDFESGDLTTGGDLDDLVITGDQIRALHIERMSDVSVWGRIDLHDGSAVVLNFYVEKRSLRMTAEED